MFPLKVYVIITGIILAGLFLYGLLFFRLKKAFERGQYRLHALLVLSIFILSSLGLAYSFIPCFGLAECEIPSSEKVIALTFDDGPNEPYTSQVLEILDHYHVPATFFLVGQHALQFPEVVSRIAEKGHLIGNHTWSHRPFVFQSPQNIENEILKTEEILQPFQKIEWIRSPHGWKSIFLMSILKKHHYRLSGWSAGLWDSDQPGVEVIVNRFKKRLKPGMILLLHDGDGDRDFADRSQTVAALPQIIEYAQSQGYRFIKLSNQDE